jgi:hypothetical protein
MRLCGRRGNQAAWFAGTSMTSMPCWNLTPPIIFGKRFVPFSRGRVFDAPMTGPLLKLLTEIMVMISHPGIPLLQQGQSSFAYVQRYETLEAKLSTPTLGARSSVQPAGVGSFPKLIHVLSVGACRRFRRTSPS